MKMKFLLSSLAALLLITCLPIVRACIGETEPELIKRYGKIVFRSRELAIEQQRTYTVGEVLQFRPGDWAVYALMIKDRCERIYYGKGGDWTEAQFNHLMEINGASQPWKEIASRNPKMERNWTRPDGTTAHWQLGVGFTVTTPVVEQTKAAIKAAAKAEAAKLPPF